jgi:outer membrane protein assembly factor BamA
MSIPRRALFLIAFCALSWGCSSIPEGRSAVDAVEISGTDRLSESAVVEKIATRPNPKFLWILEGFIYEYSIFNRFVLERDLARVERFYRAEGHYQAHVRAGRILRISDDEVRVEILVEEGPLVTVARVDLSGDSLDDSTRVALMRAAETMMVVGEAFREEAYVALEKRLEQILHDRGFAWARVVRDSTVDLVEHRALVKYAIDKGPPATLGEVTIEGLGDLPEREVRLILDLEPGDPYSREELVQAHQRLLDLGVFGTVQVEPQLGEGRPEGPAAVPIVVRVQPARLRTVRIGGGIALDAIKTDVHLRAGWEDRNFFGGLRRFSVDVRPGVVLYPLRITNWAAPDRPLPMGTVVLRLEQPDFVERHTTGYLVPEARVFPVLLRTEPAPDDPVVGYLDTGLTLGVDRPFWHKRVRLRLEKHFRYAMPFAYLGELDRNLGDVALGYPKLVAEIDLRDDRVHPHSGVFFANNAEAALYIDALDVKLVPEFRGYIPLGPHVTLASRASIGFLLPFNYGHTFERQLRAPVAGRTADEVRDLQLMYFRGFFGGGPTSNRGYPPRTLSPHAVVPFLNPESENAQLASRCERDTTARCASPVGGMTLWELSIELRFPIVDPLLGATFCDMADVAPGELEIRPDHPHLSCGAGLRVDTPAGPIRLDVAYRIPGAQVPQGTDPRTEGDPGTIFGAPINIAVGIGESF